MNSVSFCMLVMTSLNFVKGAELKHLLGGTHRDAKDDAHIRNPMFPIVRETRSADEHIVDYDHYELPPCVSLDYLTEFKDRFENWFDPNHDSRATFDEVKAFLRRVNPNIDDEFVRSYIARRDSDGNGSIDFIPEYVKTMIEHDTTKQAAIEDFTIQDADNDTFVSVPEMMHVARALGIPHDYALDSYMSTDANRDGKLSFDEFKTRYMV